MPPEFVVGALVFRPGVPGGLCKSDVVEILSIYYDSDGLRYIYTTQGYQIAPDRLDYWDVLDGVSSH